jgi:hypothetical protein
MTQELTGYEVSEIAENLEQWAGSIARPPVFVKTRTSAGSTSGRMEMHHVQVFADERIPGGEGVELAISGPSGRRVRARAGGVRRMPIPPRP